MTDTTYTPPKVWTWEKPDGGRYANTNRPIAGPTHEKVLPVGEEHLPLEDGDGAHDDEGEEDEEILVLDCSPEGPARILVLEKEGDHEARDGDDGDGTDYGGERVAIDLDGVVVEEAAEEMDDEKRSHAALFRHGAPS